MAETKEIISLKQKPINNTKIYKKENQKDKNNKKVKKDSPLDIFITLIFIILTFYVTFYSLFKYNSSNKRIIYINDKNKINHKFYNQKKEVLKCDEGYYIPDDDSEKKECQKCPIENCAECKGNKNENYCISCKESFYLFYDTKKGNKICVEMCEKGENEKCLTCEKNKCGSCNKGYLLINGKCLLNFSFKALYKTSNENENINLINKNYLNDIIELIIDGIEITPSYNYTFNKKGLHNVTMLLNFPNIDSGKMMFYNISNLISINFTELFDTTNMLSMKGMFKDCINLESLNLKEFNTIYARDFSYMFDNCVSLSSIDLSNFKTERAYDISYMFSNCISLSSISLKSFNTKNVIDMSGLFYECHNLSSIDLSYLNTKKTKYMLYMFSGCISLISIDISHFKTNNVKDIGYIFKDCSSLKNVKLDNLNTKNVINMEGIFMGCNKLTSVDLKNFDTRKTKNINKMFIGCNNLKKIDISCFKYINSTIKVELFDNNATKYAQIIINKKFYKIIKNNIPSEWEIIEFK